MNDQNTKRIIDACPSLYDSMQEEQDAIGVRPFRPIAFGFECGDGWAELLVELSKKIQAHLNTLDPEVAAQIVALQVKEKYGTLRFYVSAHDENIENLIKDAEKKSAVTCEHCGKDGKIRGDFWYYVACDEHTLKEDLSVVKSP